MRNVFIGGIDQTDILYVKNHNSVTLTMLSATDLIKQVPTIIATLSVNYRPNCARELFRARRIFFSLSTCLCICCLSVQCPAVASPAKRYWGTSPLDFQQFHFYFTLE